MHLEEGDHFETDQEEDSVEVTGEVHEDHADEQEAPTGEGEDTRTSQIEGIRKTLG